MNRIDRLTGMILLLQSHRVITAEKIAAHFEISVRTVYRDLAALGEAGVPIIGEAGMGYSLMRGYHVPPVMFTENEAAALFLSGEVTEQIADESLRDALRDALMKIRAVLPTERRDYLNRLSRSIRVSLPLLSGSDEDRQSLMPLQQAVVRKQCVALTYDAGRRGEITKRVVEPLGLVFYGRQWHLIAHCQLRNATRDFRLDRMNEWEVLAQQFSGHDDFSLKEFLAEEIAASQVIPTVIDFAAGVMERVRTELYSSSLSETKLPDGRVRVECLVSCTRWMASWLMSYGLDAEVVAPPELRQEMLTVAVQIQQRYRDAEVFSSY
ncbi:YafY family transcriptional regulator [Luteolibacter pohnpeiensis]|uniref:YafY family transcriptional regulator n=1 Tax=Luteolibacter pohnpeiensis TaxID=454153 RepID=A0A934S8B8_9BACT|nr:YafY family protein [Luteolibacter pohnpeiensis]MBK1883094.1 YafY family transcriptional regulator [Luteolibacter pohnpeiensis]